MRVLHYLVIGLFLSVAGILIWQNPIEFRQPTAAEKQRIKSEGLVRGYLRDEIERAKAEDKKEVFIPAGIGMPTLPISIEEIMRDYSLLRVKVKDKETTVFDPYGSIETWYKLDILEVLQQQDRVGDLPLAESVPQSFLPLLSSEGLLVVQGGSITVDGVRVVKAISKDDFALKLEEEYLIAASLDCGGKLIRPVEHAASVFRIEGTNLKPLGLNNRELVREIEQMYGNDLDRFRSDVRLRPGREK